jgi:hypothetical protein
MKLGIALLAFSLAAFGAHAQNETPRRFPTVSGQDLNGRPVNLPSDFLGPASLVFIPFEMKQQGDVDSWYAFVQKLKFDNPSMAAWELPPSRGPISSCASSSTTA